MPPTAILIPGQGSQTNDMRATVERSRPELLEAGVEVVGEDPFEFLPPSGTVVSAVTAEPFDEVRLRLLQALTRPVRWRETMLALQALGAERFIEVGPGRVLSGLARRTLAHVELVRA